MANACDYFLQIFNQIIQKEFYKVVFRKKIYKSIEEIQDDLDISMDEYNNDRTNQGKHYQDRMPMQTFEEGRSLQQKYVYALLRSNWDPI